MFFFFFFFSDYIFAMDRDAIAQLWIMSKPEETGSVSDAVIILGASQLSENNIREVTKRVEVRR